ncbi:hypothetical protein COO91_05116 [Nostoc flagelliforme CCNUN1]|uniref:Uncharacterized protein n=1 Tax=Nostoc flagelliforme CCNUN1 TaxID=2038116 RepID=A0A2K8SUH9_9NOSO|nr:hypothetical protein COO91_05116 [Nostoc flagelliforme CCNUN1]
MIITLSKQNSGVRSYNLELILYDWRMNKRRFCVPTKSLI